jgi:hypothetical protein
VQEKKQKEKFVDDGIVIAPMHGEHINSYKSKAHRENRQALREANLSRKERWAIYKGVLSNVMPIFAIFFASLVIAICLLYLFWMK